MILAELNKMLLNVARSNYLVNDAFIGDVYTINGKENRFGCFVATPMSAVKESGTITYNYYLYYIDRLTKDEMNIDFVQSDAVSMLKGLLDFIEQNGVEVETGSEFTLFRQQFSDWCAGAYVNVNILVADNDCVGGDFNISGYDLTSLTVDRNGIYEPGQGYDGFNRVTINVPQVGATEEWVDDEIDLKLTGYATEEWVLDKHYLTEHQDISGKADKGYVDTAIASAINSLDLEDYSTKAWVNSQGFLKSANLAGFATENWVISQGFIKTDALDGLASQTWVENKGYATTSQLSGLASEAWVRNQMYATESELSDYATQDWVMAKDFLTQDDLCGLATEQWVINWVTAQDYLQECDLDGYATENWVLDQGYATEEWVSETLLDYATKSWVNNVLEDYATKSWVNNVLEDYATEDWVENNYASINWVTNNFVDNTTIQNYVTNEDLEDAFELHLDGYATETWVEEQGYLTSADLSDFATKTWVEGKGYLTSADLSGYATRTWVQDNYGTRNWTRNNFIQNSSVWSGTVEEWDELTQEEQCSYLIAMIVE